MTRRLTQKMETFCLKYFELGNGTKAALAAGYSKKNARKIASENLTKQDIQERMTELRQKVEKDAIANVQERQEILTTVARRPGEKGDPEKIRAVDTLNKMTGVYPGASFTIDNRSVHLHTGELTDEQLDIIARSGNIPLNGGSRTDKKAPSSK